MRTSNKRTRTCLQSSRQWEWEETPQRLVTIIFVNGEDSSINGQTVRHTKGDNNEWCGFVRNEIRLGQYGHWTAYNGSLRGWKMPWMEYTVHTLSIMFNERIAQMRRRWLSLNGIYNVIMFSACWNPQSRCRWNNNADLIFQAAAGLTLSGKPL